MSAHAPPLRGRPRRALTRLARGLLFAVALALPATLAGCKDEQPPPPQKVAPLEPIPAPAGLLAEVFVPNPDEAWAKARAAVGGPALFLPSNAGNLAVTLLGLPLAVSAEIDGNLPLVGALVERTGGGRPRSAMGIHVRDAGKVEGLLVKGENARFQLRVDEKTSITLIEPKDGGARPMVIGLLGNYLLFAQEAADLLEVGPYVVRTLPTAKMPKADIAFELPREALGGPIEKGLRSSWESIRPRPRAGAAAEGDKAPTSVPSPLNGLVDALLGILVELDHARVTLDFDDRAAHLRLLGTPREGSAGAANIAAMTVGDPRRLLELPADTDIGVYLQDSAQSRATDAKKYADALAAAVGKDVPEDDRAALSAALVAVAEGRGDSFTAGASLLSTGPAIYARSDVADGSKLDEALGNLLGLAKRKSFASWLGQNEIEVSTGKTVLENLPGDVRRIRLARVEGKDDKGKKDEKAGKDRKDKPGKDKPADKPAVPEGVPSTIDVLYMLGKDGLVLAAGYDAKAAFRTILESPGKENLSGRAEAKSAIAAVGDKTAFVAFVDPLRLLNRRAGKADVGPSAPVVFSLGKGGEGVGANDPWMRLDVANLAIQELVKRRGAL
ncbi:hypothetical protein [Polyangium sp. y55x31]|uniref:hypothetical protein n=1 Tax=Polyangium sp. y55x31 TaxID=3042688 RepID=UPI002482397D|nr:hypothetical protein [Polyangium sp. y55x31]MDI1480637.1 hypothetical protein [Polyangium sp. y55x31]